MSAASIHPPVDDRDPVHGRPDWRRILAVFWVTSMVEAFGVSQIFAFMPQYLTEMGVPAADRLAVHRPVQLAHLRGRPAARPALGRVGRQVHPQGGHRPQRGRRGGRARSRSPSAASRGSSRCSLLLVGFQLGNTGVMLAAIRDVVPRRRVGAAIGLFGASSAIGFALGPVVGGLLVDGAGLTLSGVFLVSAALSSLTVVLVALTREVRPDVVPTGPTLRLAFGALRGVITDPTVRRIFVVYFVAFLANQMTRPYNPVLVEDIFGTGAGLASAVGFVAGAASLAGALASPLGGVLGDRVGFRPGAAPRPRPAAPWPWRSRRSHPTLGSLAVAVLAFVAFNGIVGPMVFALLATEVPSERRQRDPQPRVPAAVRRRHRRAGDRRRAVGVDRRRRTVPRRCPGAGRRLDRDLADDARGGVATRGCPGGRDLAIRSRGPPVRRSRRGVNGTVRCICGLAHEPATVGTDAHAEPAAPAATPPPARRTGRAVCDGACQRAVRAGDHRVGRRPLDQPRAAPRGRSRLAGAGVRLPPPRRSRTSRRATSAPSSTRTTTTCSSSSTSRSSTRRPSRLLTAELDLFVGPDFLITLPNEPAAAGRHVRALPRARGAPRERLLEGHRLPALQDRRHLRRRVVPDAAQDGRQARPLEDDIFEGDAPEIVRDLSNAKQEIINFRRVVRPMRAVLRDLERTKQRYLAEDLDIYFDDITDAAERIWDVLENYKEVVEALESTNESVLSHRLNETLQRPHRVQRRAPAAHADREHLRA